MTEADLIEALRAASTTPSGGEGFTVQELADTSGMTQMMIRKMLRKLLAGGRIRSSRKMVRTLAGVMQPIPSYVLIDP